MKQRQGQKSRNFSPQRVALYRGQLTPLFPALRARKVYNLVVCVCVSCEHHYIFSITTALATPTTSQGQSSAASSSSEEVKSKPKLPSFWVPSLTPDAKPTEIKKPVCSVSFPHTHTHTHTHTLTLAHIFGISR